MNRTPAIILAGLALAAALAGCSANKSSNTTAVGRAAPEAAVVPGATEAAAPPGADTLAGKARTPVDRNIPTTLPPVTDRQVVRSATVGLTVDDIADTARRVHGISQTAGGYLSDESTSDSGGSITLKVPNDKFDATVDELAKLSGKVSRGAHADDVTDQVVDVRSRVATAQASVDRVRALLSKANSLGDIVQLESELTRREADLESLQQRQSALAGKVALSTVTVSLSKPGKAPEPVAKDSTFVTGLTNGWHALLDSLRVLLVIVGAVLPWLIAFGVPAFVLWRVLRARRKPAVVPAEATAAQG
jgi:hypothetical protein